MIWRQNIVTKPVTINNGCWDELLQGCSGSSHHWAHDRADVCCVITAHPQNIEVSVFLNSSFSCFEKLLLTWISRFCGATIQESLIMLMTLPWLLHHNKNIFLCLNPEYFCLFDRLLLTWFSRFLWKQISMSL